MLESGESLQKEHYTLGFSNETVPDQDLETEYSLLAQTK